jgi:hypothetical protein
LALLVLPQGLRAAKLAGGFGMPSVRTVPEQIETAFTRRLQSLPPDTRRLLLAAAADTVGDVPLLGRAAERLGIGADAAAAAESTGLIEFGARARFRHPLLRTAVYREASAEDRLAVHRALAEATDRSLDPEGRAWHRACLLRAGRAGSRGARAISWTGAVAWPDRRSGCVFETSHGTDT